MEDTIKSIPQSKATESLPQLNKTLTIKVYLVKNKLNDAGVTDEAIQLAIDKLNIYFKPIALSFKICDIIQVSNYKFDNLSASGNETELTTLFSEKNTINLYLTTSVADKSGNPVSGYTYMPADNKNYIFVSKASIAGTTLAHLVGHFLNLYHTHETALSIKKELVVRTDSICSSTGDKCCDTEADPGLNGLVDSECIYVGKLKDSSGAFYQPKPKNLMALSIDACRCYYTNTQYLRVAHALKHLKKNLR